MSPTPSPTNGTNGTTTSSSIITTSEIIGAIAGGAVLVILIIVFIITLIAVMKRKKKKGQLLPENMDFDGGSARTSVSSYKSEAVTDSQVQSTGDRSSPKTQVTFVEATETNEEDDDVVPVSYDTAPVEASTAIPGSSEVITKQLNKNEKQQKPSTSTEGTTSTQAIGGGATKEPIYSDLGVAPSTGDKSLAKPEAASVQYADIESVRPKSKVPSYDDVVISGGTTVIGATGGDTNPPPIPDKKSKGAATTGQETNGGNDAARNLPHHVNDDSKFSSPSPPGRGEGGAPPGSTAADQATGTGLVSYL